MLIRVDFLIAPGAGVDSRLWASMVTAGAAARAVPSIFKKVRLSLMGSLILPIAFGS